MRTDHVRPGMRVRITGGKHKGKRGRVADSFRRNPHGEVTVYRLRATVELDDGGTTQAMPRWMEPVD